MAIGFGVLLIVIGAIFAFALEVDLSFIDDNTLGWILIIAGVIALVFSLVINTQRTRVTHVDEHIER